jgi:peptidoglycan/xylan/chitin deacetylase (PgdA/CDA1 family)
LTQRVTFVIIFRLMSIQRKKSSKRKIVANALTLSGIFSLSRLFSGPRLAVFNFHRILGRTQTTHAFDDTLYESDEVTFRNELRWMKEQADPISEDDLISFVRKKTPLPKRSFLVTFDDGYRDNYERALPILEELKIPSIFFIPTQSINDRELGWWDQVYWILKNTKKPEFSFRNDTFKLTESVHDLAKILNSKIKTLGAKETENFITELQDICEVQPPSYETSDAQLMSWEQIKSAQQRGVAIGSHTHTHRVLSRLDLASQKSEMQVSKKILETQLGKPVRSIAYPVGGHGHFTQETMNLAEECGYDVGFSFRDGVNRIGSLNRFNIQRVGNQLGRSTYAGVIDLPWLFARG